MDHPNIGWISPTVRRLNCGKQSNLVRLLGTSLHCGQVERRVHEKLRIQLQGLLERLVLPPVVGSRRYYSFEVDNGVNTRQG